MARKPKQKNNPGPDADIKQASGIRPSLFIRVKFADRAFIGPGKAQLLELIGEHGSISAAGKAMGMSYRRAWMIIDSLNTAFVSPLVQKQTGGSGGGGAVLTELGNEVVARYRQIEMDAAKHCEADLSALAKYVL